MIRPKDNVVPKKTKINTDLYAIFSDLKFLIRDFLIYKAEKDSTYCVFNKNVDAISLEKKYCFCKKKYFCREQMESTLKYYYWLSTNLSAYEIDVYILRI